ncbi:MAG: hypothetical protein HS101_15810 [Planctomycetia bacterium]|nr:hypothetical protein [Planctomycetia bacterium]MCC7315187.1 hypothetical protein [Planctomycetota bacterium]
MNRHQFHFVRTRVFRALSATLIFLAVWSPALGFDGKPTPIMDLVPSDALVVYAAKPYSFLMGESPTQSDGETKGPTVSLTSIVGFLNAAGLIPGDGQVYADIISALPLLGRYEHALALLDVSTKLVQPAGDDDQTGTQKKILRLDRLQVAVVFRTGENCKPVTDQLYRVMSRYTNRDVAALSTHKTGDYEYQRLVDERLKEWAVWEWGTIGDCFVLTFGEGAYDRLVSVASGKTTSMSRNDWYRRGAEQTHVGDCFAHWVTDFTQLRERLGEAAEGRVARVAAALQADDIRQDMWAVGIEGRALTWRRYYRRGSEDVTRLYSDPSLYSKEHLRIVPDEARHFAIIKVPTRWLVDNLPRAWVAAQSESNYRKWKTAWQRLEQERGLDIGGNLIEHIGETVILFDYPEHPLRIPFALTIAIEIDNGRAVSAAINSLLEAWSRYLDERAERNKTVLARVSVKRDDEGIWYLQAAIPGPALKVTDRYMVISWSPQALRDALRFIEPEKKARR